jgi:hypothetical protein
VKRYSKRVREEAALIASTSACSIPKIGILDELMSSCMPAAGELFWSAWHTARRSMTQRWQANPFDPVIDAEAEALIRTGWSPS